MAVASTPDSREAARWFHALSDPTRVEIIRRLSHGECCVCDLQDTLDAAQSRLSFHLRVLKEAGIVTDRRDGRWVHYTVRRDALDEMAGFLRAVGPGKHAGRCRGVCC